MKSLATILWASVLFALAGCDEYSCETFCEDRAECSGTSSANCEKGCEDLERKNEKFGCAVEYDEILRCLRELDDVCDSKNIEKRCGDEADAWGDCIIAHCEDHPTAEGCEAVLP